MPFSTNNNSPSHLALNIFPEESSIAGNPNPHQSSHILSHPSTHTPSPTPVYQSELKSIWEISEKLPGFVAAGVFDENGLIVDGHTTRSEFNIEEAAGSFIMLLHEANQAGSFMGLGASREVQIDYEQMMIILRALRPSPKPLILGIAVQKGAPLGRIRLSLDQLERALIPRIA